MIAVPIHTSTWKATVRFLRYLPIILPMARRAWRSPQGQAMIAQAKAAYANRNRNRP